MEKPAPIDSPVLDVVRRRWSPRAFDARLVRHEVLRSLFEAARWAPSSSNEQPWSFIVATNEDPEEHERMVSCLLPGNQFWARHAPVLAFSVARLESSRGGPNRHAFHDVGQAVAQLALEAVSHGLQVHQMGGIDVAKVRETFGIPETHEPVAGLAIGYPGDPEMLPVDMKTRELAPRTRRALKELVFTKTWGARSHVLD